MLITLTLTLESETGDAVADRFVVRKYRRDDDMPFVWSLWVGRPGDVLRPLKDQGLDVRLRFIMQMPDLREMYLAEIEMLEALAMQRWP